MELEFHNITIKSIYSLLDLLITTGIEDVEYLHRRFKDRALEFESTIKLFETLNLIEHRGEKIKRTNSFHVLATKISKNKNSLDRYIGEIIIFSDTPVSQAIKEYISKFSLRDNILIYKPLAEQRRRESGIRNFLIELGVLENLTSELSYRVTDEYISVFSKRAQDLFQTPRELDYLLLKQKELGEAAELKVLKFEKERLSKRPELQSNIILVSQKNVRAGYDIKSYELDSPIDTPIVRYIEVKAVSIHDYKFFWSRNEIKRSQELGDQYYLYLLPVISQTSFDIPNLEIIRNPYQNIFLENDKWPKNEELFSFRKK